MDKLTKYFDFLPYLVFIIFLAFSVFLYHESNVSLRNDINKTLSLNSKDMVNAVVSRMSTYEQVLRGGEGLYVANDYEVSRSMWQNYISRLRLQDKFPGMQAVGFTKIVWKKDAAEHIYRMRASGIKDYEIHPENYNEKMVVVNNMYPETMENLRVLGFDLHSEPIRAAMLDYAEKSGKTALSGRMILKQETNEITAPAGVLMALPIYRNGQIYGFIAAPFRVNKLMEGIFGPSYEGVELRIYDGVRSEDNLMYSSPGASSVVSSYEYTVPVDIYGRVWLMQFSAGASFMKQFDFNKPLMILIGGLVTGSLLSMLVFIVLKTRTRAFEIAEHMAQKFNESEDRYRRTFEQAAVGIAMASLDGKIIKTNSCLTAITGYSQNELKNMTYHNLAHNPDNEEFENMVIRLTERRIDTYDTEKVVARKDGAMIWTNLTVSAFFDSKGTPLYLICIVEDITRRKKAEEALVALSLRQAAILDNSLVVIAQVRGKVIEWVNNAAESMFGYPVDELIGNSVLVVHPSEEDYNNFHNSLEMSEEYYRFGYARKQVRLRKKDGTLIWADLSGKRIGNEDDPVHIWVLNDITERITAEEQLKELNSNLENKISEESDLRIEQERLLMQQSRLAAMGEMIGAIAHQWRQPLNIMALMIQNITDDFKDKKLNDADMELFQQRSLEQLYYMSSTIDDFRNFYKSDKVRTSFSPLAQVENVMKLITSQMLAKQISLNVHNNGDGVLSGVPNEFSQVILNLVTNAKDAINARKIKNGVIDITISNDDQDITVSVSDNGGGIADDIAEKIFDPYFTTKGPEKGTGIGLYMSKLIIHEHFRGTLTFRSIEGGAEFILRIPRADV
ncbi:MAG: PAS domain S-box protein [Deferribacterales bacterium]